MIQKRAPRAKARRQPKKRPRTTRNKAAEIAATIAFIDGLKPPTPQAATLFELLKSWLRDESGYDEETWPKLKKALDEERKRVGARRLFDD
jgi:hypothetical protein